MIDTIMLIFSANITKGENKHIKASSKQIYKMSVSIP